MTESHLPCQGYNTALFVSGITNYFKALGDVFRWNRRCCTLASESNVAQSFDGETATDEL